MSIEQQMNQDLVSAMKAKNETALIVLRLVKTAVTNYKIEKKSENISDDDVLGIIQKQVKQRKESIASYLQGGRKDLADKEQSEIAILEKYLPEQASETEIVTTLKKIIQEKNFTSKNQLGLLMKEAMPHFKGKADGKMVQNLASQLLV